MTTMLTTINNAIYTFREKFGIPASVLKWIAIVSMFIDHTGATVLRKLAASPRLAADVQLHEFLKQMYFYSRRIGRLAFPIFCFLLVEGYFHTRDIRKYLTRMCLFVLLSEFPFDWALHPDRPFPGKQNVYFTLLIGLFVIWMVDDVFKSKLPLQLAMLSAGMTLARLLTTDYSYKGVFLIETLYIMHSFRLLQCGCGAAFVQYEHMPTPLAFIPAFLYNGKRGRQPKYFFYFFYPAHLLFLGVINNLILPRFLT